MSALRNSRGGAIPRAAALGCSEANKLWLQAAHAVVRKHVEHLDVDRPLYPDHNAMAALVASGEILDAVEAAVGPLA